MKVQFYYTRDKDGRIDIAYSLESKLVPPYKDIDRGIWRSTKDNELIFIQTTYLERYDGFFSISPLIREALKPLPEPSWEDELPMLVTLDIQCTNINYSYIE